MSARERAPLPSGRVTAEALLVLACVLAYLALFRSYGFDVVDEGTQLAQIDRVVHGARPYLDFETGYTPGYFALYVALWRAAGSEILATRTLGIVLHAASVALLFAALRRRASFALAGGLALFQVAFLMPVAPRAGAPFNVPYPGWIAAPLALGAQLLAAAVVARRTGGASVGAGAVGVLPLLGAGALAGLAFAVKPNAGLLALGGVVLATVAGWRRGDVVAWLLGGLVRAAAVVGAVLLLGGAARDGRYVLALLVPVLLAASRGGPSAGAGAARPLRDLVALGGGFALPTAAWALPLLHALGAARFAREVLLLDGGGVVAAYLLPMAAPDVAAGVVCAAALGAAVLLRAERAADTLPVQRGGAAGLVVLGGLAVAVATAGTLPARIVGEQVCLWLGPLALSALVLLVARTAETARVHALLAFAALYGLQLFPRPDLIHVAMGAAPLLVALGSGWAWLAEAGHERGARHAPIATRVAIAVALCLCVVRMLPGLRARLVEPQVPLAAGARAPLTIAAPWASEHAWLGEAVRAIDARTAPGEGVFTFPDLAGLAFLAQRPAPFFYLYFVPGRPDRAGEQRTIDELEQRRPALAVTGRPRVPAFAEAESYFARLQAYLDEHYPALERLSGCTLRARTSQR